MAKKRGKNSTGKRINSRDKGARGERYLAQLINHELTNWHYEPDAHRGKQYKGTPDSPDVASPLSAHFEMKYGYTDEGLDIEDVYGKLRKETDLHLDIPVLIWKKVKVGQSHPPLAILRAEDVIRLLTMKRWLDENYETLPPFREEKDES